ncbi:MAG: YitT family protein [Chitinispirillia bacterium]|nr:YitT family protein [Chitinispirillia bacterium]
MKASVKLLLNNIILMSLGTAMSAFAINTFLKPNEFLSSGLAGAALMVFYKYDSVPYGLIFFIINIPVFLLGLHFIGRRFIMFTALGICIYSLMLSAISPNITVPGDKLLCALIAGAINGTGFAIIMRSSGAVGGAEIIAVILNKFYSLSLGTANLLINAVIIIFYFIFFRNVDNVLYTLIFVIVNAKTIDMVFKGLGKRKAVMIISDRWKEILDELMRDSGIGATLLTAKGGYKGSEKMVLYSIVRNHQIGIMKSVTMRNDPNGFIAIMETTDIVSDSIGNQPLWKKNIYKPAAQLAEKTVKPPVA